MPRPPQAAAGRQRELPEGLASLLARTPFLGLPTAGPRQYTKVAVCLQKVFYPSGMEAVRSRVPDGRTARAERTREAVVEALLELLDGGDVRPTAARAGVSERSVFQHFRDREALFEAAARRQYERVAPTLRRIDPELPLEQR